MDTTKSEAERAAEAQGEARTAQAATAKNAHAAGTAGTYTVQPGDTLATVAAAIYGSDELADGLYDANSAVIGSDAANLPAGTVLVVPAIVKAEVSTSSPSGTGTTGTTTIEEARAAARAKRS